MKDNGKLTIKILAVAVLAAGLLTFTVAPSLAADRDDARAIVDQARITFDNFMRDEHYTWLHDNLSHAKGLLIFPQILKAGFILGGSGGTGVLVVKDEKTCDWRGGVNKIG